ncbi:SAM-dependent methyltransferase [Kordiimonas sediminis]|uniref:SAM-dependent methyltransferase n=1 Tax=Kordiimonas sediminis TaxID=1735581 RepID=A0A919AIM6_9PROT|nr:methyltransferase domain-containing protein [Kordiimonas sediminis]GHF10543.1 SAM-dependent methyltransferase [Kordiimonas sediminis]
MNTKAELFDRSLLAARRRRGQSMDHDGDFLCRHIADGLLERLDEINRDFTLALDHGGNFTPFAQLPDGCTPTVQSPVRPDADIQEDEEFLPVEQGSFDLVLSNLVMHSINDLPGTLIQINRALKPDGLFLGSLFGGETLTELRQSFLQAEAKITGGAAPRVAPFGDIRDLGALLQRAGFALPVADSERLTVTYDHPVKLLHDLRAMGETNILFDRSRKPLRRDVLMAAFDHYIKKYAQPDGRIFATFDIVYLTGWHPHESQQKPLKPGTGKVSLGDALSGKISPKTKT